MREGAMVSQNCLRLAMTSLILLTGIVNASLSGEEEQDSQWGKEVDGCRFGIVPQHESFRYDQPVVLNTTLKNVAKENRYVLFTNLLKQSRCDVRLPNGKPAPLTLEGTRQSDDEDSGVSFLQLEPGEAHSEKLLLNRYYDMTLLGEYTVTIYRKIPSPQRDGKWIEVPSNTLKISVREYNAEEIKAQDQRESNEKGREE